MTGAAGTGPDATVTVTGVVSVERVAVGSKSERDAAVLTTADGPWLLRRPGAPTYDVDPEFADLAGSTVTVTGTTGARCSSPASSATRSSATRSSATPSSATPLHPGTTTGHSSTVIAATCGELTTS